MATIEVKNIRTPDERRDFPSGHLDAVSMTGMDFAAGTFEPGWRWSEAVGPIAGTDSCQMHHKGVIAQGRMKVRMDDGTETELSTGDAYVIPPGHDAWVLGDETVVAYDFAGQTAREFATRAERAPSAQRPFVQIIEYETSRGDEVENLFEEWMARTEGKRTVTHEFHTQDRERPQHYVDIVEFPSYEKAMANNDLPETQQVAERFRSLCTTEPRFLNLEVVQEQA